MKSELKLNFKDKNLLNDLIQKSYFEDGQNGTLKGQTNFIKVEKDNDVLYTVLDGLNNITIKIINEEIIDGSFRFIVDQNEEEIKLNPISLYCITLEDGRYSFY